MITVACVLKSGGDYKPEHVQALKLGVERYLSLPHRFVCLTDMPALDYETMPLRQGWPGWWSKIELFDGRMTGPVFFLDLDTVIVGSIDGLVEGHRFTVLANFWSRDRIGSGLMAWDADLTAIYRRFAKDPDRFIANYVTTERWGDQGFIRFNTPIEPDRWQVKHPGKVVGYKHHCLKGVPADAAIVCFGGQPRPWTTGLWRV